METSSHNQFDVIIVGGGASGMMAAGTAASRGLKVLLLEKNQKLGEKLKISGGGRCNITNAEPEKRTFLKNYGKAEQFLYSPFSKFDNKTTFSFFESLGLPLVVQARNRAFPHTEKAHDVVKTLEHYMKKGNVTIKINAKVSRIEKEGDRIIGVRSGTTFYEAKAVVLSTGGVSHPETGSTGDGFNWLKSLGHTVVEPTPTIVPLAVKERWVHALAGVSLSFMKITFYQDGVKKFFRKGKVLFTHFGLSGPLILNAAKEVHDLLYDGVVTATIDAYPDTDIGALDKQITKVFDTNKNKMLKNIFDQITPEGTAKALLPLLPIPPETKVHSITKEDRRKIVDLLKALPITVTGLMGFDRAVVADGGVPLTEVDTRTMRSIIYQNLYLTGDLLHINRPSGGYSLQLCWTTGYVVGSSV